MTLLPYALLVVAIAAAVAMLQSWLTHGRPIYGRAWALYVSAIVFVLIILIVPPIREPFLQGIVDLLISVSVIALFAGLERFEGDRLPTVFWVVGIASATVSGIVEWLAPESFLDRIIGVITATALFTAGTVLYGYRRRGRREPGVSGDPLISVVMILGLVVWNTRLVTLIAVSEDSFLSANIVTGAMILALYLVHAFLLSAALQNRSFANLLETQAALERSRRRLEEEQFFRSILHRFGTPVGSLRTALSYMSYELGNTPVQTSDVEEALDASEEAVERLVDLLDEYRILADDDTDEVATPTPVIVPWRRAAEIVASNTGFEIRVFGDIDAIRTVPPRGLIKTCVVLLERLVRLSWIRDTGTQITVATTRPNVVTIDIAPLTIAATAARDALTNVDATRVHATTALFGLRYAIAEFEAQTELRHTVFETNDSGTTLRFTR